MVIGLTEVRFVLTSGPYVGIGTGFTISFVFSCVVFGFCFSMEVLKKNCVVAVSNHCVESLWHFVMSFVFDSHHSFDKENVTDIQHWQRVVMC